MQYHAPTNQFTIEPEALKHSAYLLRYAINKIRLGGNLVPRDMTTLNESLTHQNPPKGRYLTRRRNSASTSGQSDLANWMFPMKLNAQVEARRK